MRKLEKEDQLFEHALRLFARYGYRKTTLDDIAGALGLTKTALYFYATSKQDLYERAVAHGMLKWQNRVKEAIGCIDDVVERFRTMCTKAFEYLSEDTALREVLMNDPSIFPLSRAEDRFLDINRESMAMIRQILKDGVDRGRLRPLDLDCTAELIFSVYVMFIIQTYVKSEGSSAQEMFDFSVELMLKGLLKQD